MIICLLICSQVLAVSLNFLKISRLEPFNICLTLLATLSLSKQMWILEVTQAMKLFNTSFKSLSKATTLASYTLCVSFKNVPHLLCQLSTQLMTQPAPAPVSAPVWSISCNTLVYITMSSRLNILSQVLN